MKLLKMKTLRDNALKDYTGYRLIGDVDLDGMVTDKDISMMFDAMNGKISLNEIQFKNADVDGDGKITIKDIEKINNWLIGGDNYVVRWIPINSDNPAIPNYPLTFHDYRFPHAAILDPDGVPYYQSDKQFVIENDMIVEKPYERYSEPIDPEPIDLPEITQEEIQQESNDIVINTNAVTFEIDSTVNESLPNFKTVPISIDEPIITEPIKTEPITTNKNFAVIKKGNDIKIYEYDTLDNLFKYLENSGYILLITTSDYNNAINYISNYGINQTEPIDIIPLPIPRPIPVDTKPIDNEPINNKPIQTKPIDVTTQTDLTKTVQTETKINDYIIYATLGLAAWKLLSK